MNYQDWKKYENHQRWASYFDQVDLVRAWQPETCLEIGVGNKIVMQTLKGQGIALTTLDIDPSLQPDLVASVESIPLPDQSIDVVLCAEVLEHVPFEQFETCVKELMRVTKKGVVISVPHWGYTIRLILDLPFFPKIRHAWKLPFKTPTPPGEHAWEIGRQGYPTSRILGVLQKHATVKRHWLSAWNSYHHFFLLEPLRPLSTQHNPDRLQ